MSNSKFYNNGHEMEGGLPIVENHYASDEHADGGSSSRMKVGDSSTLKQTSPMNKPRSHFYDVPAGNDQARPYLANRNLSIVHHLLSQKEAEYCDSRKLRIAVGTYNVNGQFPSERLTPWLSAAEFMSPPPDIYAIGFQELDLSQQAFLFDTTQREHDWADRVKACLQGNTNYVELRRVRLVGMFLLVYVKKELLQHIDAKSVDAVTVGTGLLNRMGNKGGVAIRFKLYDSTVCFVNTHLAAGNDELQRRNQDYREISKLRFFQYAQPHLLQSPIGLFDHDMVFWFGDLNYRLQHTDPLGIVDILDVKKACDGGSFDHLFAFDQLGQMQDQSMAFHEFREGALAFLPTYKYDPGTDNWDSSEKCRVPAWCDRILWTGERIQEPTIYKSIPQLRISDHKPVIALFNVEAKHIDQSRYNRVYEGVLREADRLENEWLPMVVIDKAEFTFRDVMYLEPQVQTLTIKNTGQVPVEVSFKPKPSDDAYCKSWMLVTPSSHTIKVDGECVLDFQVLVDKEVAWSLNAGRDRLEDILVLHLDKGKDYFLIITGNYVPSCFGQSLESLVSLTHPVRGVPVAQLIDLGPDENNSSFPPAVQLPIPKELWRLIDHIVKHGLDEPDLFGQAGSHAEFITIRDALDTGSPSVLPGSVHSVVETLLRFLESLVEPVIPARHSDSCVKAANDWVACKKAIADLSPPCYRNVFLYMVKFMKEVLKHSERNGTNVNALAMIFAPMIFRLDEKKPSSSRTMSDSAGSSSLPIKGKYSQKLHTFVAFLTQFLIHDYDG